MICRHVVRGQEVLQGPEVPAGQPGRRTRLRTDLHHRSRGVREARDPRTGFRRGEYNCDRGEQVAVRPPALSDANDRSDSKAALQPPERLLRADSQAAHLHLHRTGARAARQRTPADRPGGSAFEHRVPQVLAQQHAGEVVLEGAQELHGGRARAFPSVRQRDI